MVYRPAGFSDEVESINVKNSESNEDLFAMGNPNRMVFLMLRNLIELIFSSTFSARRVSQVTEDYLFPILKMKRQQKKKKKMMTKNRVMNDQNFHFHICNTFITCK
jgi:hypothetical protein